MLERGVSPESGVSTHPAARANESGVLRHLHTCYSGPDRGGRSSGTIPLLPEMQNSVDGVTRLASEEMSRDAVSVGSAVAAEEAGERGEDVLPERHTD